LDAVVADAWVREVLDWKCGGGEIGPGADVPIVVVGVGVGSAIAGGGGGGFGVASFLLGILLAH